MDASVLISQHSRVMSNSLFQLIKASSKHKTHVHSMLEQNLPSKRQTPYSLFSINKSPNTKSKVKKIVIVKTKHKAGLYTIQQLLYKWMKGQGKRQRVKCSPWHWNHFKAYQLTAVTPAENVHLDERVDKHSWSSILHGTQSMYTSYAPSVDACCKPEKETVPTVNDWYLSRKKEHFSFFYCAV